MKSSTYILILSLACLFSCQKETLPQEESAPEEVSVNDLVNTGKINIGPLPSLTIMDDVICTGKIDIPPTEITSIHSTISGQVNGLHYLPGDYVKQGSLVATVQNPSLVVTQRELLETHVNLEMAEKDYARKESLLANNATTDKSYEESKNRYDLLRATFLGLEKELTLYGINTERLINDQEFQNSINIFAPSSGRVQAVSVNNGQRITPETPIITIANANHKHLELHILSKDIAKIKKRQQVSFTLPNSRTKYSASISKINPMLTDGTSTLQVHCHIDQTKDDPFVAGLFVNALVHTDSMTVVGLPLEGVIKEGDTYYGYQVNGDITSKTVLQNVEPYPSFVSFQNTNQSEWVIKGAYYVE